MRLVSFVFLALLTACTTTQQTRTTIALDTIAAVVDPAYSATVDGCIAPKEAIVDSARMTGWKEAYGVRFETVAQRCVRMRKAFEVIRVAHGEAKTLLDSGRLAEAEKALAKLMGAWSALKGGDDGT